MKYLVHHGVLCFVFITKKYTSCSSCKKSIGHSNFYTWNVFYVLEFFTFGYSASWGILSVTQCTSTASLIAVNYPCACSALLLEPTTWLPEPLHTMAAVKRFLMWTPGFIKSLVSYHLLTLYSLSSHSTYCVPWQIPKKTQGKSGWPYNTAATKILHTFCSHMDHCQYKQLQIEALVS